MCPAPLLGLTDDPVRDGDAAGRHGLSMLRRQYRDVQAHLHPSNALGFGLRYLGHIGCPLSLFPHVHMVTYNLCAPVHAYYIHK